MSIDSFIHRHLTRRVNRTVIQSHRLLVCDNVFNKSCALVGQNKLLCGGAEVRGSRLFGF